MKIKNYSYFSLTSGLLPNVLMDKEQRFEMAHRLASPPGCNIDAFFEGPLSVEDVYARILALQAKVRGDEYTVNAT